MLKSTEHDVTLTSFVADLSHRRLPNFYIMCEIDAREGAESLALIFAFVYEISQENERGAPRRRILLSSTVYNYLYTFIHTLNSCLSTFILLLRMNPSRFVKSS